MNRATKLPVLLLLLSIFAAAGWPVEIQNDFAAGKRCYAAADFKKAASHFRRAVTVAPSDADAHFWLGKSYENLADISGPALGLRASLKARAHLAKAVQLAPANQEYRREYFDFLLTSDHSPGALHEAAAIIEKTPRSDPDYPFMSLQLHQEGAARSSAEHCVETAFSVLPESITKASLVRPSGPRDRSSLSLLTQTAR